MDNTSKLLELTMDRLEFHTTEEGRKKMLHFGIPNDLAFGLSNPLVKSISRETGRNHELALKLWNTGFHEAQLMASLIGEPGKLTPYQMDHWITTINSWAVCDGVCSNLFRKTSFAYEKAIEWTYRGPEYEKRAGFSMMAVLAIHDKNGSDKRLLPFFGRMQDEAGDKRNFVYKGINWALRQCGKRSLFLHQHAIRTAKKIGRQDSRTAKWVAADALRELNSDAVVERLMNKERRKMEKDI